MAQSALSRRSLNFFPIGNWNLVWRCTDRVSDLNTIPTGKSREVMGLRHVIAGDLKEIVTPPRHVPPM